MMSMRKTTKKRKRGTPTPRIRFTRMANGDVTGPLESCCLKLTYSSDS
jgi:hypothetical protein